MISAQAYKGPRASACSPINLRRNFDMVGVEAKNVPPPPTKKIIKLNKKGVISVKLQLLLKDWGIKIEGWRGIEVMVKGWEMVDDGQS